MTYKGTKFKARMIGTDLPNDPRLNRLKYWCGIFHKKKFAPPYEGGSYGNLSFRLKNDKDSFIITASRSSLNKSNTDDRFTTVHHVNLETKTVYAIGLRKPSSETMLHYAIYHARPDIQAIFHGHCDIISKNIKKLHIPITSKEEPYGTIALVKRVLETLNDSRILQMRNHGFLTLNKSLDGAGNIALEFLEKC